MSKASGTMGKIGFWGAFSLLVSNMLGTGVFTTSGFSLGGMGDSRYVLLAWLVGGAVALAGGLSYAALGLFYRQSGGEYLVLARAIHPVAGFLAGWVSLIAGFSAPIAVAALALEAYAGMENAYWLGASAIVLSGVLHGTTLRYGVGFQTAAVALKVAAILVFLAVAAMALDFSPLLGAFTSGAGAFDQEFNGWGSFFTALIWISFSYTGWNAAIYVVDDLKLPERDLRKSCLWAVALVTLLYVLLNAVFLFSAPPELLSNQAEVGRVAARFLGGPRLEFFLSLIVCWAILTSISAMVLVGPRVYAKMAQDGLFPQVFAADRGQIPMFSVCFQVALALAAYSLAGLGELMAYAGYLLFLCSAVTVGCVFALPKEARMGIGYPLLPAFYILMALCVTVFLVLREPAQAAIGLASLVVGLVVYFLHRWRRSVFAVGSRTLRSVGS